ncbi:erythrocyte membrane protein 1 (PfEMP1), putative [Plasmodium reichenowi]|uniref:Erythrocyte membrane protein 1 (PfEMP1), putative n=1 Tax=Plasmodium reichenowi TaxID=5854 RepID=A0A2P9DTZ4_PLARE|nr:erythrocyte membrane protein 1 (PfEMP1), putative [Plasmodium reichenowi]
MKCSKGKEKELFGSKHTKYITFNRVATQTNSDPTDSQLDLFYKWLDRHRDMCNKWKNKEHILHKLNEEWTMEHNEDLLYIPSSCHDDIHKINDETYNIISTKHIYIKPQTRTPHSNKSDEQISYLENNNNMISTAVICDDQVEILYNFG